MSLLEWSKRAKGGLLVIGLWFFFTAPSSVHAQSFYKQCLEINETIKGAPLRPYLNRISPPADLSKRATPDDRKSEGLETTRADQWFQFCLRNPSDQSHQWVIKVGPDTLSEIDFYPKKLELPFFETGNTKNVSSRDIPNTGFAFSVGLAPKEEQAFYLRVNAECNLFYRRADIADNPFFQATVWDRDSFDVETNNRESLFGIVVGVFLSLVIYNLLLFISARQWTSLLYIALLSNIFVVLLSLNGRLVQFIPLGYAHFSNLALVVFYPLSVLFAALFLRAFLKLKNYATLNLIGSLILILSALMLVVAYAHNPSVFAKLCDVAAVLVFFYFGVFVPIYAFLKDRLVVAKYALIMQAPLILCLVDRAMFGFGLTDQYYVPYKIVTGAMIGLILVSYFMGLIAYREKQAALRTAVEQLNISNQLKSNYNTQLEEELEQKTTDIRLMNEDLKQKANKLLQLDESKSRFFANISHEFRTPLTLIEGPLSMLLEREGFPEKSTLNSMLRNSNALKRLIDQILLLSELDENSLDLKASKLNVVQAVSQLTSQFDSVFEQKGVKLVREFGQKEISAYIDYERLQIIVNNLLSNAIKFTDAPGQVEVAVTTESTQLQHGEEYSRDEYVQIAVRDTGQGIPENELAHVFDRYFQSDSSEHSKSGIGTGIGLALVKELAELHGGHASVNSVHQQNGGGQDSGTEFRVILPLGRAHLSDNEIVHAQSFDSAGLKTGASIGLDSVQQVKQNPENGQPMILVVDDNEDMRQHIQQLLEADYTVVTAADGLLAEEALNNAIPELIITDLMMPNRNGLEFVQSIKRHTEFAKIPIIMLTARAGLNDRIKGLLAAVDDYMVKPFDGRELRVRIQNLLNKQAQFAAFYQHADSRSQSVSETHATSDSDTFIEKAKAVINQHLTDPDFGVDRLAHALHTSEPTLRRRLRDQASFTPAAFIRHCRLEKARQLVAQGQPNSIGELARSVGFSHPTYFARLYKKTFNLEIDLAD